MWLRRYIRVNTQCNGSGIGGEVQKKFTYQHYGGNEDKVIWFTSLKTWAKNLKLQVIIQNSHKGEKMFMCGEGKW